MLEKILKLYTTAMAGDVRSPMAHLFGPPGCGKSTFVQMAADLIKEQTGHCTLHTINVSRISPLELEGVQMPIEDNSKLHMLTATFWTQLQDGDILFLDEFLRGFPEVFNGLLDIFTSRQVGSYKLPKVFIIAASNTVVAYDKALEDRLLHIPVPDPSKSKAERERLAKVIVEHIGLLPEMVEAYEMQDLMSNEIYPMYEMLDQLKHRANINAASTKGCSVRNLIGQARLREVTSPHLRTLIDVNNKRSINTQAWQYVLLLDGKAPDPKYLKAVPAILGSPEVRARLTPIQRTNMELNLQLVAMERAKRKESESDEDN